MLLGGLRALQYLWTVGGRRTYSGIVPATSDAPLGGLQAPLCWWKVGGSGKDCPYWSTDAGNVPTPSSHAWENWAVSFPSVYSHQVTLWVNSGRVMACPSSLSPGCLASPSLKGRHRCCPMLSFSALPGAQLERTHWFTIASVRYIELGAGWGKWREMSGIV